MELLTFYESLLNHIQTDIRTLSHSIEQIEVVTDSTVILRNSIHAAEPLPAVETPSSDESSMRVSYMISSVSFVLDCEENDRPIGQRHVLAMEDITLLADRTHGEVSCPRVTMRSGSQTLLASTQEAFSLSLHWTEGVEAVVQTNSFHVVLRLEVVRSLLRDAQYVLTLLPTTNTPRSSSEATRLSVVVSMTDLVTEFYCRDALAYQMKTVLIQMRYETLPSGIQRAGLALNNLFLSDPSNRLLITDCTMQLDADYTRHVDSDVITLQCELSVFQGAATMRDLQTATTLLLDAESVLKSLQPPSSKPASPSEFTHQYALKARVGRIHVSLSDSLHSLSTTVEELKASYDSAKQDMSARLLSLATLRCTFDESPCLSLEPLPQDGPSPLCLCVDREIRDKDARVWTYLYLGDAYGCICPDLAQMAVDAYRIFLPLLHSTTPQPSTPKPVPMDRKRGFSLITRTMQGRLCVPHQASFLFVATSLNGMHSALVTRLELAKCFVTVDAGVTGPDPTVFSTASVHHRVLDDCEVTVNFDISTDHQSQVLSEYLTVDTSDLILTVDDRVIATSSLLVSAFSPVLDSFTSATSPTSPTSLPQPSKPYRFSFEEGKPSDETMPLEFSFESLSLVVNDCWPEIGQLVVRPSLRPAEEETGEKQVSSFPSLDFYRIVNGGIPQPLSADALRAQVYRQHSAKEPSERSFFSFLGGKTPVSEESSHVVLMQFRMEHTVRVFSVMISSLSAATIDRLTQPGFASLFGTFFEMDLLAWSELDRCFRCIKTLCIPIETVDAAPQSQAASMISSYRDSSYSQPLERQPTDTDGSCVISEALAETLTSSATATEFFEMAAPYSTSSRYQIIVHLRHVGETSRFGGTSGIVKSVGELIQRVMTLTYFISFPTLP